MTKAFNLDEAREREIRDNPFHPNSRNSDYLESALRDVFAALDATRKALREMHDIYCPHDDQWNDLIPGRKSR